MASVSSTSSSTSSSTNSLTGIKGYTGIASGLDVDSLIYSMTLSTRSKIAKQKQNKQLLAWKQTAYRSISDKLVEFSNKYTSYSSSTNLLSSKLFSSATTSVTGTNASKVSVSGTSTASGDLSIVGVSQLASDTKITTNAGVSDGALTGTSAINFGLNDISTIAGSSMSFQYGSSTYYISLPATDEYQYGSAQEVADSINKALSETDITNGKLSDKIKVEAQDDGTLKFSSLDKAGNTVKIKSGSDKLMSTLGLNADTTLEATGVVSKNALTKDNLFESKTFADLASNKTMTFSYNGKSATITLPDFAKADPALSEEEMKTQLQESIQKQLNSAFGTSRILVDYTKDDPSTEAIEGGALTFKTLNASNGEEDTTSTLKITSASSGLLGTNGVLGIASGSSNRLNMTAAVSSSGLKNYSSGAGIDGTDLQLSINGTEIKGLTTSSSLNDIMKAINSSDAGVTMTYSEATDKFTLTSKEDGAAGKIVFDDLTKDGGNGNFMNTLFGVSNDEKSDYTYTAGQDAKVMVQYASGEKVEIQRGSNSFNLEGMTVSVNGLFNESYADDETQIVKFSSKVDTGTIYDAVKAMVDDYNSMCEVINKEVSTKPNRSYAPLTDEQKEDMTDKQIEQWEEKANSGLLFNDTDLSALATNLRTVFTGSKNAADLAKLGINVSTSYSDNGKITLDESKFKAALETNLDDIKDLFTGTKDTSASGKDGIMTRLKTVTDRYASTTGATKGILINKAGSTYAATSVLSNSIQKQMDEIDKTVKTLQTMLENEQDRYQSKFTSLETLISEMNSQSSYLSSMSGN